MLDLFFCLDGFVIQSYFWRVFGLCLLAVLEVDVGLAAFDLLPKAVDERPEVPELDHKRVLMIPDAVKLLKLLTEWQVDSAAILTAAKMRSYMSLIIFSRD